MRENEAKLRSEDVREPEKSTSSPVDLARKVFGDQTLVVRLELSTSPRDVRNGVSRGPYKGLQLKRLTYFAFGRLSAFE